MEKQKNPSKNAVTWSIKVHEKHSDYVKEINNQNKAPALGNCSYQ